MLVVRGEQNMLLKRWDKLPDNMKTEAVKPYYDIISKKKVQFVF